MTKSVWCEGSGWSQRGGDDNMENGLAKKREKAEMSGGVVMKKGEMIGGCVR